MSNPLKRDCEATTTPPKPAKRARLPAPELAPGTPLVRRLYIELPVDTEGDELIYTLYTQPDADRSARVHAAAVALSKLDENRELMLVDELMTWISAQWSIHEARNRFATRRARFQEKERTGRGSVRNDYNKARLILEQFETIGDAGREHDVIVYKDGNGLSFAYDNAAAPLTSVLAYPYVI